MRGEVGSGRAEAAAVCPGRPAQVVKVAVGAGGPSESYRLYLVPATAKQGRGLEERGSPETGSGECRCHPDSAKAAAV